MGDDLLLKASFTNFKHQSLFTSFGECYYTCEEKLYKAFCSSREAVQNSDKLLKVMSLEATAVGSEDHRSENEKKKKSGG